MYTDLCSWLQTRLELDGTWASYHRKTRVSSLVPEIARSYSAHLRGYWSQHVFSRVVLSFYRSADVPESMLPAWPNPSYRIGSPEQALIGICAVHGADQEAYIGGEDSGRTGLWRALFPVISSDMRRRSN